MVASLRAKRQVIKPSIDDNSFLDRGANIVINRTLDTISDNLVRSLQKVKFLTGRHTKLSDDVLKTRYGKTIERLERVLNNERKLTEESISTAVSDSQRKDLQLGVDFIKCASDNLKTIIAEFSSLQVDKKSSKVKNFLKEKFGHLLNKTKEELNRLKSLRS